MQPWVRGCGTHQNLSQLKDFAIVIEDLFSHLQLAANEEQAILREKYQAKEGDTDKAAGGDDNGTADE